MRIIYSKGSPPFMHIARSSDAGTPVGRRFAFTALPYLAAFLIPFFVLCAAFALGGIYPFGSTSVMLYDMPLQYVDYFGWLSEVLRGEADLLYSNAAGLGGGMFSLFTYYLSSPFNLLAAFWQPEDMPKLFSVLYLLKIPAAAVTFLVFLRGRLLAPHAGDFAEARKQAAAAPAYKHVLLVALVCTYALSGYVLGYASNIMWLDGVVMLPLAALGVYRFVQRRTHAGAFFACALAVVFNWYTGYMVCLYAVLYFFYELVRAKELKGKRLRLSIRFGILMLLVVGASLFILLPTALSLMGGKGGELIGFTSIFSLNISHNPLAVPSLFCIGTLPGVNPNYNTPAVALSAFALMGMGVFFANGAISRRAKATLGIFAVVIAIPLVLPGWATVWSGFVAESSYTNRSGFAILMTFILLAAEGMLKLNELQHVRRARAVALGGGIVTAIFAVSELATWATKGEFRPSAELAALEVALLAGCTVLAALAAYFAGKKQAGEPAESHAAQAGESSASASAANRTRHSGRAVAHAAACVALAVLFAGEQVYACYLQLAPCCYSVDGYNGDVAATRAFYEQLPATDATDADGNLQFTRVGNAAPYWGSTKIYGPDNMALELAYSTFDHYSSTQESSIQELLANLGYSKLTPVGTYYQSTNIVADALLGVTHIIDDAQPAGSTLVGSETLRGTFHLYRNDLALPLGWGTTGSTHVGWQEGQPFVNDNAMLSDAADNDADVFEDAAVEEQGNNGKSRTFAITPAIDGPVYLYTPTLYLLDLFYDQGIRCDVYVDGQLVQTVGARGSFNEVCLGQGHAGQSMTLTIVPLGDDNFEVNHKDGSIANTQNDFWNVDASDLLQAVSADEGTLREQLARIDSNGFSLTAYENGHIAATFDAEQDETLVISQPYEDGWSVTVNGQPAELEQAYDGLMGVKVAAGENDIELTYTTPGLIPGAAVSIVCVTLFGVWRFVARKRKVSGDK